MDVRIPVMDGVEANRRIRGMGGPSRVLVLTTFDLDEHVYAAMQAGASGFLLKDVPRDQLIAASTRSPAVTLSSHPASPAV